MNWEYRKLGVEMGSGWDSSCPPADRGISELNRLGREGWEVTRVIQLSRSHGLTDSIVFLLRRETMSHAPTPGIAAAHSGL